MKWLASLVLGVCVPVTGLPDDSRADTAEYGADAYAPCAACHLPTGEGISGAFPKIRNRATGIAALDGGREYLITVTSYGLMGPMTADSVSYAGVMPGHGGSMSAGDIAAALNHLVFELTDEKLSGFAPFSADEVTAVQEATKSPSPMAAAALRAALQTEHGEAWPP